MYIRLYYIRYIRYYTILESRAIQNKRNINEREEDVVLIKKYNTTCGTTEQWQLIPEIQQKKLFSNFSHFLPSSRYFYPFTSRFFTFNRL